MTDQGLYQDAEDAINKLFDNSFADKDELIALLEELISLIQGMINILEEG